MSKVTFGLLLLSLTLALAFFAHALATGIAIPYPDPTPAQAAYQRFHHPISMGLFLAAGASVAAFLAAGLLWGCIVLVTRLRHA